MVQLTENEALQHAELLSRNTARAARRADPLHADPVSDDEDEGDPPADVEDREEGGDDDIRVLHRLPLEAFRAVMRLVVLKDREVTPSAGSKDGSNSSAVFFKVADEKLRDYTGKTYEIADPVWQIVQAGVHLILPSITTASLKELATNPGSMKTRKGLDAVGSKKVLLDQSMFGREEDLPENLWHEAWHNQDVIYRSVCEPEIYTYFKNHWSYCSSQEEFSENYAAILAFNSFVRRTYVHSRVRLTGSEYTAKFSEFKLDSMFTRVNKALSRGGSGRADGSSYAPAWYGPYPSERHQRGGDKPFSKGARSNPASSLCLICARRGHISAHCTNTTSESGGKLLATWSQNKLLLISNQSEICLMFNLRSDACCSSHRASRHHICSLCGSKEHGAYAGQCA